MASDQPFFQTSTRSSGPLTLSHLLPAASLPVSAPAELSGTFNRLVFADGLRT